MSAVGIVLFFLGTPPLLAQSTPSEFSKRKASLYKDIFDQNLYYEGIQYLHLERLTRDLARVPKRSANVNVFDEVPDSTFFTNRHGRERMSLDELKKGPAVTEGPDRGGAWTITKGKFEGLSPGFFIQDRTGDKYLLKFDPIDYPELATGAEVVASRFYHALGYNVPQYTIVTFPKHRFEIAPGTKVYDETGFQKPLTPERLEEFLLFAPQNSKGWYRAVASRILEGGNIGPMKFQGQRRDDPEDWIPHEDLREIRALQVFSSWLNNYDVRESNSLDLVRTEDGKQRIYHYLIDFNSSLGARAGGPKSPQFGHEHIFDYGEAFKAFLSLGFYEKPWQRRWDETGGEILHPSAGYFDNRYFDPGKYKTQLPYFPFKDLTRADGFWAAKILMKFTDEEIRALVSTGKFSDPEAEAYLVQVLIERRDRIGHYWFREANALDEFQLFETGGSYELRFRDLAVEYGFESQEAVRYQVEVIAKEGRQRKQLAERQTESPRFTLEREWLDSYPSLDLLIRTHRDSNGTPSPWVRVEFQTASDGKPRITGIFHED